MRLVAELGILMLAAVAAACAPKPLPLVQVVSLEANDGSFGQDIYGKRRAAGDPVPPLRGNQVLNIRTYLAETNDFGNEVRGTEMAGAECEVKTDGGSARVRTPGAVHVPLYGYRTPQLSVQCVQAGFADGIVTVGTFNKTHAETMAIAAQGGIIGVVLGAAVNAASDITNDDFYYVPPAVLMRPGEGSGTLPSSGTGVQGAPAVAPADAVAPEPTSAAPTQDVPAAREVARAESAPPPASGKGTGAKAATGVAAADTSDPYNYGSFTLPGVTEDSTPAERKCRPYCS